MSSKSKKYYYAYEDRYKLVYRQGVEFWSADPEEIGNVFSLISDFFKKYGFTTFSASVIEFGCGEGFIGEYLLQKGFSYLGVDLSKTAVDKARHRVGGNDSCFIIGDITNLFEVKTSSFDVSLDNYCLHMLLTDEDRENYLSEIHRVLKPDGKAWFHEISQKNRFTERIESFEDFIEKHPVGPNWCEFRQAFSKGAKKTICLPRLPARFNNCEGYREEFEKSGFEIQFLEEKDNGVVVHAKKR
jgi:SAM-dependent methyltransferase